MRAKNIADPPSTENEAKATGDVLASTQDSSRTVVLNTALHIRLMRNGEIKPSTYETAMRALHKLRASKVSRNQGHTVPNE